MEYIILSLIGLCAVLVVRTVWKQPTQIAFILSVLLLGVIVLVSVETHLFREGDTVQKGTRILDIPWFDIILYFVMLLGIAAKYFYDAIGENNTLNFQKWQLFKPMLVSPMVFGGIYGNFGEGATTILLLLFAFQNGFFWKTVLDKTPQGGTIHSPGTVPLSQPPPHSSAT